MGSTAVYKYSSSNVGGGGGNARLVVKVADTERANYLPSGPDVECDVSCVMFNRMAVPFYDIASDETNENRLDFLVTESLKGHLVPSVEDSGVTGGKVLTVAEVGEGRVKKPVWRDAAQELPKYGTGNVNQVLTVLPPIQGSNPRLGWSDPATPGSGVYVDHVTIVGAGTEADPYRVNPSSLLMLDSVMQTYPFLLSSGTATINSSADYWQGLVTQLTPAIDMDTVMNLEIAVQTHGADRHVAAAIFEIGTGNALTPVARSEHDVTIPANTGGHFAMPLTAIQDGRISAAKEYYVLICCRGVEQLTLAACNSDNIINDGPRPAAFILTNVGVWNDNATFEQVLANVQVSNNLTQYCMWCKVTGSMGDSGDE